MSSALRTIHSHIFTSIHTEQKTKHTALHYRISIVCDHVLGSTHHTCTHIHIHTYRTKAIPYSPALPHFDSLKTCLQLYAPYIHTCLYTYRTLQTVLHYRILIVYDHVFRSVQSMQAQVRAVKDCALFPASFRIIWRDAFEI